MGQTKQSMTDETLLPGNQTELDQPVHHTAWTRSTLFADNIIALDNTSISIFFFFLHTNIWCAMHEKGHVIWGKRRPWSACAYAQADLGLRCPLTESGDSVVYVDEQKMPRLDCTDAHADLDLCFPKMHKGPFRALGIYVGGTHKGVFYEYRNKYFPGEVRKISKHFPWKKCLILWSCGDCISFPLGREKNNI